MRTRCPAQTCDDVAFTDVQFKELCKEGEVVTILQSHFGGGQEVMEVVRAYTERELYTFELSEEETQAAEEVNKRRAAVRDKVHHDVGT